MRLFSLPEHHPSDPYGDDEDSSSSADSRHSDQSAFRGDGSSEDGPTANITDSSGGRSKNSAAHSGSRAVFIGKILVVTVLVLSACTLGIVTYFFISNQQESNFKDAFDQFGQSLLEAAEAKISQTVNLLTSLTTSTTAYAVDGNLSFPFITLPHYAVRAQSALVLSGADFIGLDPLITSDQVPAWEKYAVEHQSDLFQSLGISSDVGNISTHIQFFVPNRPYYVVSWAYVPFFTVANFNYELAIVPWFHKICTEVMYLRQAGLSSAVDTYPGIPEPLSNLLLPVFADFSEEAPVVAFQSALIRFKTIFQQVLPPGTGRLVVEATDSCGSAFSYSVDGPNSTYLGQGLLHDPKFAKYRLEIPFARFLNVSFAPDQQVVTNQFNESVDLANVCQHTVAVYPTELFRTNYHNSDPYMYAVAVICVFIFTTLVFVLYDWMVRRYQAKVAAKAERSQAIVASLFPKNVQDRILQDIENDQDANHSSNKRSVFGVAPRAELKQLLDSSSPESIQLHGKPIADLFTDTTVMFADICNFTAWSSSREPSQVFILLETIYRAFDEIADRRRVFKVETVGDCYMAVAGLPDPRPDHAVVMARYANDCLNKFSKLTKQMEVTLGPDTTDLGLRVGLHSGPVTAGVLRGQRARFQLFGDTVNTAARMESNGERNRIQISEEMAALLTSSGKGHWCQARKEKVTAKGKGELQTFWLQIKTDGAHTSASGSSQSSRTLNSSGYDALERNDAGTDEIDQVIAVQTDVKKHLRLVDWNTEILVSKLKVLVAFRRAHQMTPDSPSEIRSMEVEMLRKKGLVSDEVEEVLWLPDYHQFHDKEMDLAQVDLGEAVLKQLHDYVHTLSKMYRTNSFHNFEHASHVTMSVNKLFSRIIAPEISDQHHQGDVYSALHDHTYGITSDPLTQFAVVLAALIHDVDHPGVTNTQLIKEKSPLAVAYRDKSVAEQNSVDISWNLLMDESFEELRRTIYVTTAELRRFRQWLVNTVMATDIMDKDLKSLRNARWEKAFDDNRLTASASNGLAKNIPQEEPRAALLLSSLDTSASSFSKGSSSDLSLAHMAGGSSASLARNRKATIIIEHLIQASDVAHTMQHWHVYRKWNTRLFMEMYQAHLQGRGVDPFENWFQGEMGFFDYYVIPLASKLKECGVFGVSSEEYLTYAKQNRAEWEMKGQEVVEELKQEAKRLLISRSSSTANMI